MLHTTKAGKKHPPRIFLRRAEFLHPLALVLLGAGAFCFASLPESAQAQPPPAGAKPPEQAGPAKPAPPPAGGQPAPGTNPKPPIVLPRPVIPPPVTVPSAPPLPPPAGRTPPVVAPPPSPVTPFPLELDVAPRKETKQSLAGFQGGVFLRDASDDIRIQLKGRLHLDFNGFAGAGTSELTADRGSVLLSPRFFMRRARIEVAADLFRKVYALFGLDFGGQPITNPSGGQEISAAPPGQAPTSSSARFAPFQTTGASAVIANAYIDYTVIRQFHVMLGQHQSPFSLENRTGNNITTWMERNLPIRSFVVPNGKEIGATVWGDWNEAKNVSYELGVFIGDGPNRPQVDGYPDFIGRIFSRPFARGGDKPGLLEGVQIGVSGHRGARDPKFVGYDYPAIVTGQGFTLWDPRYRDSRGRLVRVIPSGTQNRIGGELRLPIDRYELRTEAYWVDNGTREAFDGLQLDYSERFGAVRGVGWYLQLSAWVLGDAFVTREPGFSRPPRLDLTKKPDDDRRGLEVVAIVSGIQASYDGASRDGVYDVKTPGAPGGPTTNLSVLNVGLGANYWYTKYVRASINWLAYHTPDSGTGGNLAQVPGNLVKEASSPARGSTWMHEIGMRLGVQF